MILPSLSIAFFLALLLLSHARSWRLGIWLFKPLASLSFLALTLRAGALESPYGRGILVAQTLCLVGDVLLIPHSKKTLIVGMGAFLVGHVVFGTTYAGLGLSWRFVAISALVLGTGLLFGFRWLRPHLSGRMRVAVPAYMLVLASMVVMAIGAAGATGRPLLGIAALFFFASDIGVARNRFVKPGFNNRLWALPLYYLAQALIGLTALGA